VEKSGGVDVVVLEDAKGKRRTFPLGPGFWVDGQPVRLTAPRAAAPPAAPTRTASGSVAVAGAAARTARASRILVEGRHDAELVERVWGDDLRVEGVVVELLDGVDDLDAAVRSFAPRPGRRIGVLVDHLVPGSKESRIVAGVTKDPHVLVVGHPFIDVWQGVRPQRLGWQRWPTIPRGQDWKHGILAELGCSARLLRLLAHGGPPGDGPAGPRRGADRLRDGRRARLLTEPDLRRRTDDRRAAGLPQSRRPQVPSPGGPP
jgi:hypothetical protein